jgi:hypothetical protein
MSQRLKAGLSWPRFAVCAGEPLEVSPACRGSWSSRSPSLPSGFVPVVDIPGVSFQSRAEGVDQGTSRAISFRFDTPAPRARMAVICSGLFAPCWSWLCGVAHGASRCAVRPRYSVVRPVAARLGRAGPSGSTVCGVGREEQPLSDVRSANARRCKIGRPEGVACRFQINRNSVEPLEPSRARNLLSKHDCRAALSDEPSPRRPKVARVREAFAFAGCGKWLAWAGASPNRSSIGPAGESQRVGPSPDAGEEVAGDVAGEVGRLDKLDVPLVNVPGWDEPVSDELAQPGGSEAVVLVVVDTHARSRL